MRKPERTSSLSAQHFPLPRALGEADLRSRRSAEKSLNSKNIEGRLALPDIKRFYEVTIIENDWHKNRQTDQCKRSKNIWEFNIQ